MTSFIKNFQHLLFNAFKRTPQPCNQGWATRRAPRIPLTALHKISYLWHKGGHNRMCLQEQEQEQRKATPIPLSIINISTSGVALAHSCFEHWPNTGSQLKGSLLISENSFPLALQIIHFTKEIVGCAYVEPTKTLVQAIEKHLLVEMNALKMNPMDTSQLTPLEDEQAHWFHGEHCDLFYTLRNQQILRFNVVFFGNYIEGGTDRPIRFGVVSEAKDFSTDNSKSIRWLQTLNAHQLESIIRMIQNIPTLAPSHREAILKLIF